MSNNCDCRDVLDQVRTFFQTEREKAFDRGDGKTAEEWAEKVAAINEALTSLRTHYALKLGLSMKPEPIRCLCGHSWNDHHRWLDPMEHSCAAVPCKGDGCKCTMFDQQ